MHIPMIYLDNAATSHPKPEEVYLRVDHILRTIGGNPGRASHRMALEAARVIFEAREGLARLLGVTDSSRLVFTKNATESINIALKGLVKPGDQIVTTAFEHNSVARPVRRLENGGAAVTRVTGAEPGLVTAEDIKAALTEETKLVTVTHASNVFGTIQPVAEIGALCKREGVLFMIDAAQTAGAMPLDIGKMDVDIVAG
ncbi:MAG: aminotransferase class V-fold PLP-dependent enzyme, partial [Thermodesulfobacteriota bacterium]